jgi:hypothetical protein
MRGYNIQQLNGFWLRHITSINLHDVDFFKGYSIVIVFGFCLERGLKLKITN